MIVFSCNLSYFDHSNVIKIDEYSALVGNYIKLMTKMHGVQSIKERFLSVLETEPRCSKLIAIHHT